MSQEELHCTIRTYYLSQSICKLKMEKIQQSGSPFKMNSPKVADAMKKEIEYIRTIKFPLGAAQDAFQTTMPFDDPCRYAWKKYFQVSVWDKKERFIAVGDLIYVFLKVVEGTEFASLKIERFIGFLCGFRLGQYEAICDLVQQIQQMINTTPAIEGATITIT